MILLLFFLPDSLVSTKSQGKYIQKTTKSQGKFRPEILKSQGKFEIL